MRRGEVRSPAKVWGLLVVTGGLYGLWWAYEVMGEINAALREDRFRPELEVALVGLTCGLYAAVLAWRLAHAVDDVQVRWRGTVRMDAPVVWLLCLAAGAGVAVMQLELNDAWEHGTRGPSWAHKDGGEGE